MYDWDQRIVEVGVRQLAPVGALLDDADPGALVAPRNRMLCAGLGLLSVLAYKAFGGRQRERDVERAGALLSLLTKVDDQVIDGPGFHGCGAPDRCEIQERTTRYLDPTLRSLQEARPVLDEGRCRLAAELGGALRALAADPARLQRTLDEIALGWSVQARAVALLSARPGSVARPDIEQVTTAISEVWLRMMARVGELPADARGQIDPEVACFSGWGRWIQRADALADLAKDTADGLCSSLPGLRLWELDPGGYERACREGDSDWFYRAMRAHGVDRELLPTAAQLADPALSPASLGELPALLRHIHGFLAWRYEAAQRREDAPAPDPRLFAREHLPNVTPEAPCSAP